MTAPDPKDGIPALLDIMARLRDPATGCPWDVEQNFATIAPYTIEEAYEVADAIERDDMAALKSELGDLLFQVVFHARMAEEAGAFDFNAVCEGVSEKMLSRHPHVFGDADIADADAQTIAWEEHKARERAARAGDAPLSVLADVPLPLPALLRAEKLTKRAARVGFDWPDADRVLEKLDEELGELAEARTQSQSDIDEELGDILFVIANLARKLGTDPETALRAANAKFERRFHFIEARLAEAGRAPDDASLEEMETLWNEAKAAERALT